MHIINILPFGYRDLGFAGQSLRFAQDREEHGHGQESGLGVLPAGMIDVNEGRPTLKFMRSAVLEREPGLFFFE